VGDCIGNPGPKQGHLAMMQATIAAEHIAWRVNRKLGKAYLPEFRCVMDQGAATGSISILNTCRRRCVGNQTGPEPYQSKIRFEQIFWRRKATSENFTIRWLNKNSTFAGRVVLPRDEKGYHSARVVVTVALLSLAEWLTSVSRLRLLERFTRFPNRPARF